jgi:hypothetical protein
MDARRSVYINFLTAGLCLLLIHSCATVPVQRVTPPFDSQQIDHILSVIKNQEGLVHTFYATGRLTIRERDTESDSNVLILGIRNPLKIKIEVTHPWGRPLLHFLIQTNRVSILSFREKRLYNGHLKDLDTTNYFPGKLRPDQIWAIVRGYPFLGAYAYAISKKGNQIMLLDDEAKILQVFDFHTEYDIPISAAFAENGLKVSFSDFENNGVIQYSRNIRLDNPENGTTTLLKYKKMVFNKTLPSAVFDLEMPAGFKAVPIAPTP